MRLIHAREIQLICYGDKGVCALAGDAEESVAGYGDDAPAALADLPTFQNRQGLERILSR